MFLNSLVKGVIYWLQDHESQPWISYSEITEHILGQISCLFNCFSLFLLLNLFNLYADLLCAKGDLFLLSGPCFSFCLTLIFCIVYFQSPFFIFIFIFTVALNFFPIFYHCSLWSFFFQAFVNAFSFCSTVSLQPLLLKDKWPFNLFYSVLCSSGSEMNRAEQGHSKI